MDQILDETQLPIKVAAFGHCFRTEAGAAGELAAARPVPAWMAGGPLLPPPILAGWPAGWLAPLRSPDANTTTDSAVAQELPLTVPPRAGAAGRGLYRVHQFSKVEMFVVCTPEQSDAVHAELIELETSMYADLGLHFKV